MKLFCMACGKPADGGLFCSKACNDRQATDPFCPTFDVATGLLEVKCRGCNAELSRPGDLLGIQTTNGVSCIKCLGKMLDFLRTVPSAPEAERGQRL